MTTSASICLSLLTVTIGLVYILHVIAKGLKDLRQEADKEKGGLREPMARARSNPSHFSPPAFNSN
jgi:hypothetical protein